MTGKLVVRAEVGEGIVFLHDNFLKSDDGKEFFTLVGLLALMWTMYMNMKRHAKCDVKRLVLRA